MISSGQLRNSPPKNLQAVIVSGDRDMLQLSIQKVVVVGPDFRYHQDDYFRRRKGKRKIRP